jgi:hypothetical protein
VAVIFAASQRLSVSVIMATIAAAAGAIVTSASIHCSVSPVEAASRGPMIRNRPRRIAPVMLAASLPSVSRAAIVVSTAKPAIQSRMRPTGYHSSTGAAGDAPLPAATAVVTGRPSKARCPSHQAGSATVTTKAMQ